MSSHVRICNPENYRDRIQSHPLNLESTDSDSAGLKSDRHRIDEMSRLHAGRESVESSAGRGDRLLLLSATLWQSVRRATAGSPGSRAWRFRSTKTPKAAQSRSATRDSATEDVAFRFYSSNGISNSPFRRTQACGHIPLRVLRRSLKGCQRINSGDTVDRHSLSVEIFHPFLHVGLSQRFPKVRP